MSIHEIRRHRDIVLGVAFDPEGTRVVTASWDGTARIWRAEWMTRSPSSTETWRCLPTAIRANADIGSPCEPVTRKRAEEGETFIAASPCTRVPAGILRRPRRSATVCMPDSTFCRGS